MINTKFKRKAKLHQVSYRENFISIDFNKYVTWLSDKHGAAGANFYKGFKIFDKVKKRYPNFYVDLYSDMLRSEHIPFNLFIPFKSNLEFCKNVFNELIGGCIKEIPKACKVDGQENVKIEFAPSPKENYLNDRTSFDTYIEYIHQDGSAGIIGIEVKYTEREYKLKIGSTEDKTINDKSSKYYSVSKACGLYKDNVFAMLKEDEFRQIWRNHLLVESMRINHQDKFKYASSLLFYPADNGHFKDTCPKYIDMIRENNNKFIPVTYENFIAACYKHCPNNEFKDWIDYLRKRYIIIINQ